jgi:hypothetical protein
VADGHKTNARLMKKYFIFFSLFIFFLLWLTSDLTVMESVSVVLFVYAFLELIYDLGKRVVILDFAVQAAIFTCLVMPVIFYHVYTRDYYMARLWIKYMPISSDEYFSFALPAVIALAIGFRIPLKKYKIDQNPKRYLNNVETYLKNKPYLGLSLIGVGVVSGLLNFLSPTVLKQVFFLMEHLTFVGVFYVIYSPYKNKRLVVSGVIALMLAQTLVAGMFGELVYLLACSLVLILLGKKISFGKKLMFALTGIFLIMIIQSVKVEYRKRSWLQGTGADPLYFGQLVESRLSGENSLLDANNLFFTSVRMNQGWLVAVTMKMVPERYPFGDIENVGANVASTIVPRFVWPNKPEAGGKENLKRFWGFKLRGYSMNLGPLGEAYANFNITGGIFYMFLYGLFFNFVLSYLLKFSEKRPTIVLWLPFLMFYAISVETDLVTTMGSLMKGIFFTWLVFKAYRIGFRIDL